MGAVNLADQAASRGGANWPTIKDWPTFDDGFLFHAQVSTLTANAFGLHHVHGNVWEWVRDYGDYRHENPSGDGARPSVNPRDAGIRGGGWINLPHVARSANRYVYPRENTDDDLGVRPAMRLPDARS